MSESRPLLVFGIGLGIASAMGIFCAICAIAYQEFSYATGFAAGAVIMGLLARAYLRYRLR